MKATNTVCSICGFTADSVYFLTKHRKEMHPDSVKVKTKRELPSSPLDLIHQGEDLVRKGLKEIDTERNKLQNRLRELDDLAAKWNKMINVHV